MTEAYPERVILFGSEGGFSHAVLLKLLAHDVNVIAIVMPGIDGSDIITQDFPIPIRQTHDTNSLAGLALTNDIPVLRVQNLQQSRLEEKLTGLTADILFVACFPLKLPRNIWQLPALACWNLHPSLLPRYRGPDPLYWQIHNRELNTGVTLHEVTDRLDAGDIVAQQATPLPDDISEKRLNVWVAEIGVELFVKAMMLQREGRLQARQQDESRASYYPLPGNSII